MKWGRHVEKAASVEAFSRADSAQTFRVSLSIALLPRAVIANDHKLGGLKEQAFILSQFWSLDVWSQGRDPCEGSRGGPAGISQLLGAAIFPEPLWVSMCLSPNLPFLSLMNAPGG